MNSNCLNCSKEITANFCPNCGQKTSVHQYSVKHFIEHDLVHGIFHVDKGVLYTIKILFTNPGNEIREFIQGKRVKIFNFVTLLLIVVAVSHFIGSFSTFKMSDLISVKVQNNIMQDLEKISNENPKLILVLTIPFYSIITFFWFKKAKLNLTEHFVLNSYRTAGELVITALFTIITVFYTNISGLGYILAIISIITYIYSVWFYKQFFSVYGYSNTSLIIRSILSIIAYFFVTTLIGILYGLVLLIKNKIL
jgi:Protein of unknown function (DUF3667)